MRICLTLPFEDDSRSASFALPYGMAVIASILRSKHPGAEIFFSNDEKMILQADEIYCSGLSESWDIVNMLAEKVVAHGKRFVVGGQHVTALPQTLKFGEIFSGPLEVIDKKWPNPLPDWSIFSEDQKNNAQYVVMTSRGCPFKCKFCSSSSFWRGYFPLPVDRVIQEITQVAALNAKEIVLFDDLFTADKRRLRQISERIVAEGLNSINYSCLIRADSCCPETLELLQKMNVKAMAFGAESGSDFILTAMNKKTSRHANQTCIDMLLDFGFTPVCSVIIGFPGESRKTLSESLLFIEKNIASTLIEVYPVQPLPGTWLWDYFVEQFAPDLNNFDWKSLKIRGNTIDFETYRVLSNNCSAHELKQFLNIYEWLFKQHHNIRTTFDRVKNVTNILKYKYFA